MARGARTARAMPAGRGPVLAGSIVAVLAALAGCAGEQAPEGSEKPVDAPARATVAGTGAGATPAVVLAGSVRAADGTAAPTATVTARSTATGIEYSVYSGGDGAFAFAGLPAGEYEVHADLPGFASAAAMLALPAASELQLDLAVPAEPLASYSSDAFLALLPEGEMKREFILNCGTCHGIAASRVLLDGAPRDEAQWLAGIKLMRALDAYDVLPPDFDDERYAAWLAEHLSAEALAQVQPRPRDAAALAGARITEYPLPRPEELPHDLVIGPDGRVWITAFWFDEMWALDPDTGAIEAFPVDDDPEVIGQVRALEFDDDGILWIVLGGTQAVVRFDPATGEYRSFDVGMYAHSIALDSSGQVWVNDYFSKPERIGRLDVASGEVEHFALPSANLSEAAGKPLPYGLQIDPEDRLWSTQLAANTVAMYEIGTGRTALYPMPDTNVGPRRPAIGVDGALWIPEWNVGRLSRFDAESERFETFDLGSSAVGAYDAEVDPRDGTVWVTGSLSSSLIRFDPATGEVVEYPMPTEPAFTRHLAVDPETGDVWSAYSSLPTAVPKVVRLQPGGDG